VSTSDLRRIAEGREAEIFAWGEGEVLRLLRRHDDSGQLPREMAAMEAAARAGVPVPAVREIVEVDGRSGLVMERIIGMDLLTLVGRQPWKLWSIGRATAELHAQLHEVPAPEALRPLREVIRWRLVNSPDVPAEAREKGLAGLEQLPDGDRICHGDFHPGNILAASPRPVIIDWVGAARGDPVADFARTILLGRAAASLPHWSRFEREVFARGRRLLMGAYGRAYRKRTNADLSNFDRWFSVRVAERFADAIPEERETLFGLLAKS
jgi:aminoglycoside phosphotransferase (APT) family kinase protein